MLAPFNLFALCSASRIPFTCLCITVASLLMSGLAQTEAHAAQVTLRWDYTASGAAGFILYCGSSSRNYPSRIDVGNTDTYTIGTLTEGSTSYCAVTAYDPAKVESGYSNEASFVVPYAAPVVNFSATPTSGPAPLSVAFTNATTGQVTSWAWNFGDGTTSTAQNPTHVYSIAGSYKPVLTATGPGGSASKTATTAISVGTTTATSLGTVSNTQALGLVAAYGLNEGSGSTVADISGNNNKGTLTSGVSWTTQGKVGNALLFNGSSGRVDIADAASLRLTGTMTLEAWVKPATVSSTWRDVIYKGNDNYYLMATSGQAGVPAGRAGANKVFGTSALSTNTWTHLAVTYDKATLRLYVNGVQASSVASTGSITTSTYPLQLGGDSIYGQYFQGVIDEVRVYNRALSQSEIQTDMNTAVTAVTVDTTPPSVPLGLTATTVGSAQINLAWSASTDNVGVTGYRIERCQGAGCTNFTFQVATASAMSNYSDTGLAAGTSYRYRVRATDGAGNLSGYSSIASAATQADTSPRGSRQKH